MVDKVPAIYGIISKISKEVGAIGLTKSDGVPFPFRGIDTTVNILAPLLQEHGVIVVPNIVSATVTPREAGNRVVKTTEVVTEFNFIAIEDGSTVTARTAGLADDFSDRSTAQAQSVAFRVALLQTFTLPTQVNEEQLSSETADAATKARAEVPKEPTKTEQNIDEVRSSITELINDESNSYDGSKVNAFANKLTGKPDKVWGGSLPDLKKILKGLQDAVSAEQKTGEIKDV